jgi:CHAD domain-containing protein
MDALAALAATISHGAGDSDEDRVQLLEKLGAKRLRFAKRLHHVVTDGRKRVLHCLGRFSERIDHLIENAQTTMAGGQPGREAPTEFLISRSGALSAWTRLDRKNLHRYRLGIKEFRYALELAQDPDETLLEALRQTRDAIGEWHDWCGLENFACKLLDGGEFIRQIHSIADRRFADALELATDLQGKYFKAGKEQSRAHPGTVRRKQPILISAARMSA